ALVEVEELVFLLHERALALQRVTPAVVLAGELAARARGLFTRVVLPHELVAPVPADVVEGAVLVLAGAHDDDRRARRVEFLGEVAADPRQLLDAPDVQPGAAEDGVALALVVLRRDRVLVGHGAGSQAVVLGPTALAGLLEVGHGASF